MKLSIPNFVYARVLVVGDVMLDRYWHGDTSRISPEAPVPVVRIRSDEERPGGAANVALNIAALGAQATLLGIVGADEPAQTLERRLAAAGVTCALQHWPTQPTITKLRVISHHQQLIRLDFEDRFDTAAAAAMTGHFAALVDSCDVVVLSDYGKGSLHFASQLIATARAAGKYVLVDPKGKDFSIYRGAGLITPNLHEFEAVVGHVRDEHDLVAKGKQLIRDQALDALLITRGEHGMTLLSEGLAELHLPARAREVFDVTGAGDTVISVLAATLAAGQDMAHATALANVAAGIVVGKLGTAVVSIPEIRAALRDQTQAGRGVMSEDQLLVALEDARAHGERVIFTNGCFDILHAGHVAYLERAKALGHRLIVAVNDDASVARLKGAGRPINPLERRMAVVAGLASVDWVVAFSEDTPERLICRILPDFLVKGGDYRPSQIAGYDCVTRNGGEVRVLGFEDGCSTSGIIAAITQRTGP
ncbi:MAG: bifunctional D-glycero-beta-D-manno-heptose-7-phosphate kinase/D-glycero-beta-D-manno-heptose 1-phosphate adenylyltransferase HldE [Pseudomonadota bacterium]